MSILPPTVLQPSNELLALLSGTANRNTNALLSLLSSEPRKRRSYFAFHFDDIIRTNVVRNAWKIDHPDAQQARSFYDSSLWERRQIEGDEAVKRLIREGAQNTSAVCVLVGTQTWLRRWVRYEIARAIIDNRGLLAVHLNSIKHHETQVADPLGHNPLSYMGICKTQETLLSTPRYYICELKDGNWVRYQDYSDPVNLPPYLADPEPGFVRWLSAGTTLHDYIGGDGHRNIGSWINFAARQVGR